MSLVFRIILIVVSLLTTFFILRRIRQSKVQIEDSIFWIVFSFLLIILSVFPQIADFCSSLLGIYSTVNFIFLVVIFVLIVKIFLMTIRISQLDTKVRTLTQKFAIEEKRKEEFQDAESEKND